MDRRISGSWVQVHTASIGYYEKYIFYSGVPAAYRGRIGGGRFGIGAAWTLSPPKKTP